MSNTYKVNLIYDATLRFEQEVIASNDEAAIRKLEQRVNIFLRSITQSYDVNNTTSLVEKCSNEMVTQSNNSDDGDISCSYHYNNDLLVD